MCLSLKVEPRLSAASSIIGMSYSSDNFLIASMLQGTPKICTGIIAFGFLPKAVELSIADSNKVKSIFQLPSSESIKIGSAPQ